MARHNIVLYSPTGEFLTPLRWKSIDVTLAERDMGVLTVALFPEYRDDLFQRDSRIALMRYADDPNLVTGTLVGDTLWLLTHRKRVLTEAGQHTIVLSCQHPNALLARRVVAYAEKTAQADKADLASENIYAYINENFVSATDTTRNWTSTHFVLDPSPNPAFGASANIAASYRNVLDVLNDICQSSAAQGTYVGFEVYTPVVPGPFHVRIYSGQRGTDRGFSSGQPFTVHSWGNMMSRASVEEDWSTAISFVYAGGAGKEDERLVQTASDAVLIAQTPYGRYEHFEATNTFTTGTLDTYAEKVLRDWRPRRGFEGTIAPNDYGPKFGFDYDWGDIIGAQFAMPVLSAGQITGWVTFKFDVRVNPVHIQVVRTFDENEYVIDTQDRTEVFLQSVESS